MDYILEHVRHKTDSIHSLLSLLLDLALHDLHKDWGSFLRHRLMIISGIMLMFRLWVRFRLKCVGFA